MTATLTTASLLATFNTHRAANGMSSLKSWKESRAALESAIATFEQGAAEAEMNEQDEKRDQESATAAAKKRTVKRLAKEVIAKTSNKEHVAKAAASMKALDKTQSFNDYLKSINLDAKVARAKLRRAGFKAPYAVTADLVATLSTDRRRK